jgi:hypothetical protein
MLVTLMTALLHYAREWETSLCIAMSVAWVVYVLWRPRWTARLREALTGLRIRGDLNSSHAPLTVSEGRCPNKGPTQSPNYAGPKGAPWPVGASTRHDQA